MAVDEITEDAVVVVNVDAEPEPEPEPVAEPVVVVVDEADDTPTLVALAAAVGGLTADVESLKEWRKVQEDDTALAVGLAETAIEATAEVAEEAAVAEVVAEAAAVEAEQVSEELDEMVPDESQKHWFFMNKDERKARKEGRKA